VPQWRDEEKRVRKEMRSEASAGAATFTKEIKMLKESLENKDLTNKRLVERVEKFQKMLDDAEKELEEIKAAAK